MKKIKIAGTDITVSRISMGTASLHHICSNNKRKELLYEAADNGITHFDTSPYYGHGIAEAELGKFLKKNRKGFSITTKIGLYPLPFASKYILNVWTYNLIGKIIPSFSLSEVNWQLNKAQNSFNESLKRLNSDYVDFLLLHEPQHNLINSHEFMAWLECEIQRGRILAYGIAGIAEKIIPFIESNNPLAKIVQTKDSLENKNADFLINMGRELQFTYGYLSSSDKTGDPPEISQILKKALIRNNNGSIIVSTRKKERIKKICSIA